MALISVSNLKKYYPENNLFKGISFSITKGEKLGLVGRNGSGKTTLFKIIVGEINPSEGEIHTAKNLTIGYLSQKFDLNENNKVKTELLNVFKKLSDIYKRIQDISSRIDSDRNSKNKLQNLLHKYERLGGYEYETKIKQVMGGLNLLNFKTRKIKNLSGGEKVRVALAKVLVKEPDIMLLDEPTNHLDLGSVRWLGEFIQKTKSAVMIISHSRYLLRNCVNKIAEIRNKKIKIYKGNYDFFKKKKKEDIEHKRKKYKKQKKKINKLKSYIRKYKEGNRSTMAKSREKMLEKISLTDNPQEFEYNIELNFNDFKSSGQDILRIKDLNLNGLLKISELNVFRSDKIGVIGKNGCGKTTLLNTIIKAHQNIKYGKNLKISYFQQNLKFINENINMLTYLNKKHLLNEDEAREYLGYFDFSEDEAFKIIKNLSGGERARFKLLDIILESPNLIIMDEPTNHLDIDFLEVLEKGLNIFKGTLIIVSHDIFFLKNIVNKLWIIKNKQIKETKYGVKEKLGNLKFSSGSINQKKAKKSDKKDYIKQKKERNKRKKLKKDIRYFEDKINELESEIQDIYNKMEKNSQSPEKLQKLFKEKKEKQEKILNLMKKWDNTREKLD